MPRGFPLITGSASAAGALKKLMVALAGSVLALGVAGVPNRADALLLYTIRQVGSDVVVTGGSQGTVDLSPLTPGAADTNSAEIVSGEGALGTGPDLAPLVTYSGISGPTSFGSDTIGYPGDSFDSDSNSVYLLASIGKIYLPTGYTGSGAISSTTTFSGTSLAVLGLTPNTSIVWTWGTGGPDRTFQLDIEPVPAPLPVLGAASAFGWSRRLRRRIRGRAAHASAPNPQA